MCFVDTYQYPPRSHELEIFHLQQCADCLWSLWEREQRAQCTTESFLCYKIIILRLYSHGIGTVIKRTAENTLSVSGSVLGRGKSQILEVQPSIIRITHCVRRASLSLEIYLYSSSN